MTKRTLAQWLHYLEQLHPVEMDLGLERIRPVAQRLGVLTPAKKVVTVTGTNGKGSTCAFLASLLEAQNARVGVYSSPHFLRYNERIQVCGAFASDEQICAAFDAVENARGATSLTYFEFGTLAALLIFAQSDLDVAILEVGLGGRLDAVNIVDADIAVITSIAVDHEDWLGGTRESVAFEKSGIFRQGKPAICGDLDAPRTVYEQAQARGALLCSRGAEFDLAFGEGAWHWRGINAEHERLSLHDLPILELPVENAAIALQVYALLNMPWNAKVLADALKAITLTGRYQRVTLEHAGQKRHLILDVAHNPHAAQYLANRLETSPITGVRYAVFGALSDKDVAGVIQALKGQIEHWNIAALPSPRSYSAQELESLLHDNGVGCSAHEDIAAALRVTLEQASEQDEILVFGSFFTVAQVLEYIGRC